MITDAWLIQRRQEEADILRRMSSQRRWYSPITRLHLTTIIHALTKSDHRLSKQATFSQKERIWQRQLRCRANMRGVPTRGQGLYEVKHGTHGVPFQSLPEHIRNSYETFAESGQSGYNFRENNSAYRRW